MHSRDITYTKLQTQSLAIQSLVKQPQCIHLCPKSESRYLYLGTSLFGSFGLFDIEFEIAVAIQEDHFGVDVSDG
jgi:hypothetical protein